MDPRIETALDEWGFRACDPGYAGLHALADAEFTGGVTADQTVGFMVNGRLVGLAGGSIESFWGTDFTALEAEGPDLPLLCAMLTAQAQEEGEYYTGETPISEVDETLSSGGFTGYLELSENVFSGDYFVVYYGGTSFSVAFLGTEDQTVSGPEARERAAEEVGIYTVNSVSIDVIEIPDPDVDESASLPEEPSEGAVESEDAASMDAPGAADSVEETTAEPGQSSHPQTESTGPSELTQLAESALGEEPQAIGGGAPSASDGQTNDLVTIPALDPERTARQESSAGKLEPTDESSRQGSATSPEEASDTAGDDSAEATQALEEAEAENERLRERIGELETTVAELKAEDETGADMSPDAALDGTNLFVRYETSANFTLPDALSGNASREEVTDNLRLERHTTFETEELTVEGQPFGAFLEETTAYQFCEWLLGGLLFEIIGGGGGKSFAGLIDAIPEIDRIEFSGEVPVHTRDAEEREAHTYTFDLVCRNSMGDPVLIADVHDARTPVTGDAVGELLADANTIAANRHELGGAFFVSRSYFEPAALETVADATGGSLLRGKSKESYVSVSRKHGFHLCLVEARDGSYHLTVPDD